MPKFRVAITWVSSLPSIVITPGLTQYFRRSGAGIGGLTFGVVMAKFPDVEVVIYEATQELAPIGAGIGLWPRVQAILSKIDGLQEALSPAASAPPTNDTGICNLSTNLFNGSHLIQFPRSS